MEFWLYVLLFFTPSLIEEVRDPVDGILPSPVDLRDLDCEPTSIEGARTVAPGRVDPPMPRGDLLARRAVICRERLMPHGVRRGRDDAILSTLRETADEAAALVTALEAPLRDRTWLVEVFHPDQAVGHKIGFAVKNALLDRRVTVTDRVPTLAAGDIEVLGRIDAQRAYPLACTRYLAAGSMDADDALLGMVLRDSRATIMNVGVCADGRWRWVK